MKQFILSLLLLVSVASVAQPSQPSAMRVYWDKGQLIMTDAAGNRQQVFSGPVQVAKYGGRIQLRVNDTDLYFEPGKFLNQSGTAYSTTVDGALTAYQAQAPNLAGVTSYTGLSDKPLIFSGAYNDLSGKPNLFTGNYNDLTSKPTIPSSASQVGAVSTTDFTNQVQAQTTKDQNQDTQLGSKLPTSYTVTLGAARTADTTRTRTVETALRTTITYVSTIASLTATAPQSGTVGTYVVTDPRNGGTFNFRPASASLTVDNGLVFSAPGGYWVRQTAGWANPLQYGAKGDSLTDDTQALLACIQANKRVDLLGLAYKYSGGNILPGGRQIRNGEIVFTNDGDYLRFGKKSTIQTVTFTGTLSTMVQYSLVQSGVTSFFSSPTYQDYAAGVIAGSDFGHTLTSNVMSTSLPPALTGALGRMVVSAAIPLDASKRYIIVADDGIVSGDGAAPIQFWICNASGAEQSRYIPAGDGTWQYLSGAATLKIKVGSARHDHTKLGLVANFDLSKIRIYQLVNDFATYPTNINPEDATNVNSYSDDVTLTNCTFQNMKYAAFKIVGGKRNVIKNCFVSNSLGGFTTQGGRDNKIILNDIDLRVLDASGTYIESGYMTRNHGVGVGSGEYNSVVSDNKIKGPSWAIENAEGNEVGADLTATDNVIDAVHCGMSICSTRGKVNKNVINLSTFSHFGIELPTANYVTCTNNVVSSKTPALQGYGLAASTGLQSLLVKGNSFLGFNTGMQIYIASNNADKSITVADNQLDYYTTGIYSNAGGTTIERNRIRNLGHFSANGLGPSAAIQIESLYLTTKLYRNTVDGAASYCMFVNQPQIFELDGNTFNSFAGNYVDLYINMNAGYPAYPKLVNNTINNPATNPLGFAGSFNANSRLVINSNAVESPNNGSRDLLLTNIPNINMGVVYNRTPLSIPYSSTATTLSIPVGYPTVVFSGTSAATWTLPLVGYSQNQSLTIKNRGSAAITLNRAGTDNIYTTATVTSLTINPGESVRLINDATYWSVL